MGRGACALQAVLDVEAGVPPEELVERRRQSGQPPVELRLDPEALAILPDSTPAVLVRATCCFISSTAW